MKVPFVDLGHRARCYRYQLHQALDQVLNHGMAVLGPEVAKLEDEISRRIRCGNVVSVANGTDALILGLRALGITSGEVITTPMSYLASTSSISLVGATPVFADVGPDLNLDPSSVIKLIGRGTRAILLVHLAGNPARVSEFRDIADAHNIHLIEDCAQAFGAEFSEPVGTFGSLGATSFHPLKTLGALGDGGAIFVKDDSIAQWLRMARNHGHSSREQCEFWSINSRLDSVQAGFLTAFLADFDSVLEARRGQARRYYSVLKDAVRYPMINPGAKPSYNFFYVLVERRQRLIRYLNERGIDVRVHYPIPIHRLNASAKYSCGANLQQAERYSEQVLSLPIGAHLSNEQIDFVSDSILTFYS